MGDTHRLNDAARLLAPPLPRDSYHNDISARRISTGLRVNEPDRMAREGHGETSVLGIRESRRAPTSTIPESPAFAKVKGSWERTTLLLFSGAVRQGAHQCHSYGCSLSSRALDGDPVLNLCRSLIAPYQVADSLDSPRRLADTTTVISTTSERGHSSNDRSPTTIQVYPSGEGVAESIWPLWAFTG